MLHHFYHGKVIHGLKNGGKFGFPTANILLDDSAHIDKGVYAVKMCVENGKYGGMLYVGTRPTLNLSGISVEINIFDFDDDIYGKNISFEIVKKIRGERKFVSIEELIAQMEKDKETALQYVS
jgi:riboflavin kinase/FMN adenylyltransferase